MTAIKTPPKLVSLFTTTLAQSIGDGDTETITLTNTARLTQGAMITLTIDRVDANGNPTLENREVIQGIVSGNNLTNYTRGYDETQAQAHNSGAIIEVILVAADYNAVIDAIVIASNPENLISEDDKNSLKEGEDNKLFVENASDWRKVFETATISSWNATDKTATITFPIDTSAFLSQSMKGWLKQGNNDIFFNFTSNPTTTATITVVGSGVLTNGSVTDVQYSTAQSPHRFPVLEKISSFTYGLQSSATDVTCKAINSTQALAQITDPRLSLLGSLSPNWSNLKVTLLDAAIYSATGTHFAVTSVQYNNRISTRIDTIVMTLSVSSGLTSNNHYFLSGSQNTAPSGGRGFLISVS